MNHRYALVNRPAGIGCVPRGLMFTLEPRPGAGMPHHDRARHGILVSERELTPDELRSFELARIVDGEQIGVMAKAIAAGPMHRYATEYVRAHEKNPEIFNDAVMNAIDKLEPGVMQSIGDMDALTAGVLELLIEDAKQKKASTADQPAPQTASPRPHG